jgi:hypothetical protein
MIPEPQKAYLLELLEPLGKDCFSAEELGR